MTFVRPAAERVPLARSPLSLVIAQIQFEPILRLNDSRFIADFQERLRASYPTLRRVAGIELVVGPDGLDTKEAQPSGWSFGSPEGDFNVVVNQSSLSLEARQYTHYEELRDRFLTVLDDFVSTCAPGPRTRLALRYVNKIDFDEALTLSQWRELVRPELLGLAGADTLVPEDVVMSSLGQTRFAVEESQLVVRYGYSEPVFTGVEPPPVDGPDHHQFFLDLDQFDARAHPEIDPAQIADELDLFHETIHRVFRWALTDKCIERLGVRSAMRVGEAT